MNKGYTIRIQIISNDRSETDRHVDFEMDNKLLGQALFNVLCSHAEDIQKKHNEREK